jgi:hypothetical protein
MVSLQYAPSAISPLLADDLLRLFEEQLVATSGIEATTTVAPPRSTRRKVAA